MILAMMVDTVLSFMLYYADLLNNLEVKVTDFYVKVFC